LLNNPRVPNIVEQLTRLAAGGIQFHCQMVVVPDLNDGDVLEQSLTDLWAFGESVISVALVPVGLTQFSHLYTGAPMSSENAGRLLDTAERWGARARRERGDTWVYGSDELYLLAGRALPNASFYGDLAQIENGVGAVAALRQRVRAGLRTLPRLDGLRIGVVTGTSMAPLMPELLESLAEATGAQFVLAATENSLFGPTVTTAGLLVSADIRRALATAGRLDAALIPAESLNDDGVFLDDVPLDALRAGHGMPIQPSYDFVDVLSRPSRLELLKHCAAV
jgi:NifB/MoaA-like Fe-S oxidoreductase